MADNEHQYPTDLQRAICWGALTGLALVVIVSLIVGLLFGMGTLFMVLQPVLLPVVIAGFLAYLLSPIVAWVSNRVHTRIGGTVIVMMAAGIFVAGFAYTIVPQLVHQSGQLVANRENIVKSAVTSANTMLESNKLLQNCVDMAYNKVLSEARAEDLPEEDYAKLKAAGSTYPDKLTATFSHYSGYLVTQAVRWLTAGTKALSGIGLAVVGTIMVPVFLFYFLVESESIKENWHRIIPMRHSAIREEIVETLQQINGNIVSFVRGQMLVSLIDGVLLAIALRIAGLPYAVTIGMAAACLGIIPYLGMISTWIPAVLIAWFSSHDTTLVIAVTAIFGSVSFLDSWVIQPKVVGSRVKMHDLTVMFSVLFWSYVLGGVVGALLAVPLTACIKVVFVRYVWPSLNKDGDGAPGGAAENKG